MATNCESCDRVLTTFERKLGVTRCPSCIELQPPNNLGDSTAELNTPTTAVTDLPEEPARPDALTSEHEEETRGSGLRLAVALPVIIALALGATIVGAFAWENRTSESTHSSSDSSEARDAGIVDQENQRSDSAGRGDARNPLSRNRDSDSSVFPPSDDDPSLGEVDFSCRSTLRSVRCDGDEFDSSCSDRITNLGCDGESLSPGPAPLAPSGDRDILDGCNPGSYATYDDYRCGGTGDAEHTEGCNPASYATYDDYRCGGTGDAEHTEGCNPAGYATYDDYRCGGN